MKKDKLQFYVSVTQILSSLAVLISIIILITEYRRSGIVNEKSLENLVYSRMMEMDKILIENREIAEIVIKAHEQRDTLSHVEAYQYRAFEHIFFDSWETLWVGFHDGLVDIETWNDWDEWFAKEAANKPPMALEGNLDQLSGPFIVHIRQKLGSRSDQD